MSKYKAFAKGKLLDKRGSHKTVVVSFPDGDEILVVLCAPSEKLTLQLFEGMGESLTEQVEMAATLLVEMAYAPLEEGGDIINRGTEDEPVCLPGEQMFEKADIPGILDLPVGHPMADLRTLAANFAGDLGSVGKSSEEPDDGGTTASPSSSEESTSETLKDGTQDE